MLKEYGRLALVLLILTAAIALYVKGCTDNKTAADFRAVRGEVKSVARSNEITRKTQRRVDSEGAATREQAERDERALDEATDTGAAGGADDPGVRIAREAYERALCAARRVQREGACTTSAAAP